MPKRAPESVDELFLDSELVRRMKRYKRHPSIAALRHRFAKHGDEAVERAIPRLLHEGKLAVTSGVFWLRKGSEP